MLPGAGGIWYGRGNDRLGLGKAPPGPGLYVDWDAVFSGGFTLGSTSLTEAQLQQLLALI